MQQRTAERMAEALIRHAGTGPVEIHHLRQDGFSRDEIARYGRQAIDLAARERPDLHHPGNALPENFSAPGAATKPAYAVRGRGQPARQRQSRKAGAR